MFDRKYFEENYENLKEGYVLHELRAWETGLNKLDLAIIDAGNWASNRPCARYYDPANLDTLLEGRIVEYGEKIELLREGNETLNDLEILLQKDEIKSVPSTIYLDITNVCNFRCKMCYQSKMDFKKTKLMNDHMAMVILMLPYMRFITVAGLGEPLLSDSLQTFSESAKNLRCHTCLITNGSLIRKRLEILKHFSLVSISFDGAVAETFETLRHGSNFKKIVKNIRLLRKSGRDLNIGFSVVVSRANLDELSGIVQMAGELGVNEISMNPLENMPILELKSSDRTLFEEQISELEKIAEQHGITLTVSIDAKNFSSADDRPRDKVGILNYIRSLDIKKERHYDIRKIIKNLEGLKFSYYPAPAVFTPEDPGGSSAISEISNKNTRHVHHNSKMDLDAELLAITRRIDQLTAEIKSAPKTTYTLPYCLDPWKLNYIKSNGKKRLCCHADIIVGDLGEQGLRDAINSEEIKKLRRSMFHGDGMPPECGRCRAADRFIRLESLRKTCEMLQIELETRELKGCGRA
ncbi:MAG: radical SAM protein [Proteobacteria bacterium]|nr:radical SAM protein [Pseudomonadota bacterium]